MTNMAVNLVFALSFLLMVSVQAVEVKVGMLNMADDVVASISRQYLFPAAQIAMDTIAKRLENGDFKSVKLSLIDGDDCCTRPVRSTGALAASLYMEQGVDAFLGPAMSPDMIPVADMAAYWNLPVVSGASTTTVLGDKTRFPTLVRTSPSMSLVSGFLSANFKHFGWKKCVILRGFPEPTTYYSSILPDAVYAALEADGVTVVEVYADKFNNVDEAIEMATSISKIVLLSTSPVVDIMVRAHRLGYTKGSHTFLYWYPHDFPGWQATTQFDNLEDEAVQALDALLVMRIQLPDNDEYREFQNELRVRHLELYGTEELGESYFAATTHDALLIYAQVIDEIAADDPGKVRDGKAIVEKMRNRSFQGVTGDVYINENGDRYGVCELLDLNEDMMFSVVGTYDEATQTVDNGDINWPGETADF